MDQSMKQALNPIGSQAARLWRRLVTPHPSISEVGNRQQTQLIAALALVLGLLNFVGIFAVYSADGGMSVSVMELIALAFISVIAYGLGRSRYYVAGALVITVTLSLLGLVGAIYDEHPVVSALFFVPFSYVIAMGTLSWQAILGLSLFNLLAALMLPVISTRIDWNSAWTVAGEFVTTGGLSIAISLARNAVERARLAEVQNTNRQLFELNTALEQRVRERTRDIAMAAEVGRRITQVTDLGEMLNQAVRLIQDRFGLYHVQVYLVDHTGRNLVLKASTGEAGREMLRRNHRLAVDLTSLNGSAAVERRVIFVANTQASASFRPNPLLPETRSEMAIPLISGARVLGVLDLQSTQAGLLAEESLPAFEALAGQLTTALINADLFAQAQKSLSEVQSRSRRIARTGWEGYLDALERKERLAYQYDQAGVRPANESVTEVVDPTTLLAPIEVAGEPLGAFQFQGEQPWSGEDIHLVRAIAGQVAQQIENLRLLNQAEQYRRKAEEAVRRLTRHEWDSSLAEDQAGQKAYLYAAGQVQPIDEEPQMLDHLMTFDIKVQNEPVGRLGVPGLHDLSDEDAGLVTLVSEQLGNHLENMRLYARAQRELQERQKVEQSLQSQQRTLQAVLDNMPVGVIMLEAPSGKVILSNKRAGELLGRGIVSGPGAEMNLEVFPLHRYGTDEIYPFEAMPGVAGLAGESLVIDDVEVRRPDGARILLQVNGAPVFDPDGRVMASVAVFQDITRSHEAQEMIAKRAVELAMVAEVSTRVSTLQNPEEMLQTVVNLTRQAFQLYHAHVYLLNDTGDTLVLAVGAGEIGRQMASEGRQIPVNAEKSLVARAARSRSGVIVNDVRLEPEFLPHRLLPETRSELAVPMIVGDRLLGVLDIQAERTDRFTPEDVNIMTTLAAQVAVSLQNARSFARAQRQAEREALINTISERIQATNSVEGALQVAVREIGRALGAQHTAIRLGVGSKPNGH